ncbi:MAG: PUA domain-containing protein [Promethearchaeota archaeon]
MSLINERLYRVRGIANYQFRAAIGHIVFPDNCHVEISKSTRRIRRIFLDAQILATVRAHDGFLVLTIEGARRLHNALPFPKLRVVVIQEIAPFISKGRSVFAKHVKAVDPQLRAGDEVIVVDGQDRLLAVGRASLSPQEMLDLTRGVAVKTRHSTGKQKS